MINGQTATIFSGGVIKAQHVQKVNITDSVFTDNVGYAGGALDLFNANVTIIKGMFSNNIASTHGGAVNMVRSTLNITQMVFNGNRASRGL